MLLNCLHLIASLNSKNGGPSRSIPGLCDALVGHIDKLFLVSQRLPDEQDNDLCFPSEIRTQIRFISALKCFGRLYSPMFNEQLSNLLFQEQISLIHSHGLWLQCNHESAKTAKEYAIPYIVSPRGMMEPWAFAYNAWKKKIVWFLWQKKTLENATAFCATSDQEAESIRRLGFKQPIAIIPNGIDLPAYCEKAVRSKSTVRYALFLSRIHPKKGLCNLVKAWSLVKPSGWKVIIAGPNENEHQQEVQKEIDTLGLQDCFEFVGSVEGERKLQLYRDADLFVLPTHSENFGIVVAEALASGTPVITTKGAPWEGLVTHKCGWWVEHGVKPLAEAIKQATALNDAERIDMGKRGREYVSSEFGWDDIGEKMTAFYEWVLNGGTPPECVRLD